MTLSVILVGLIRITTGILILALLIRGFASWFGIDDRFAFIRFLARITDPFIAPIRRFVRPIGFFDISFLITLFLLLTVQVLLLQSIPN